MEPGLRPAPRPFSLARGGPFHHLLVRLGIWTPAGLGGAWVLALIAWLPLAIGEGIRYLHGEPIDPAMLDISVHVRVLFTLPALLYSERLLDEAARSSMASFIVGNFCDLAPAERIAAQAERLRDTWVAELILLAIALLGGQLVLWRVLGSTGAFHGGAPHGLWSFPRIYYASFALPLVQFVMFRWLWRWFIWTRVLRQISRLALTPLPTHADRAGGLGALARPISGFAGFVLANGAILSAAWGTKVIEHRATLKSLLPSLLVFLLVAIALAIIPYLPLSRHLFRARRRALAQYGDFMRGYTLRFHAKWIDPRTDQGPALGTPDIQSLADLGHSYQVVQTTRVFVFGPRNVLTVWFAGILPMIPLFWSALSVETVLKRILTSVLGGLPI